MLNIEYEFRIMKWDAPHINHLNHRNHSSDIKVGKLVT